MDFEQELNDYLKSKEENIKKSFESCIDALYSEIKLAEMQLETRKNNILFDLKNAIIFNDFAFTRGKDMLNYAERLVDTMNTEEHIKKLKLAYAMIARKEFE